MFSQNILTKKTMRLNFSYLNCQQRSRTCCVDEIPPIYKEGELDGLVYPSDRKKEPLFHQVTIRNSPPEILMFKH